MSKTTVQNIVIVGGGNGGLSVFNGLASLADASKYNIILINNRSFFNHRPAGVRLVTTAEGNIEDTVLVPFKDSKFNTGNKKLIVGEVTSVVDDDTKGRYVVLNTGEQVEFSILILSPGSVWEGPLAFGNNKSEIIELATTWRTRFQKARDIVIVGGGSIGTGESLFMSVSDRSCLVNRAIFRTRWRNQRPGWEQKRDHRACSTPSPQRSVPRSLETEGGKGP